MPDAAGARCGGAGARVRAVGGRHRPAPGARLRLLLELGSGRRAHHVQRAERLLRHGAITNYNGDPLGRTPSLAHVLLTAALARLTGLPVATAGHLIVILAGAACPSSTASRAPSRPAPRRRDAVRGDHSPVRLLDLRRAGGPLFALTTLLAVAAAAAYLRRATPGLLLVTGLALGLAAAARPEGGLVSMAAALGLVLLALLRARRAGRPTLANLGPELSLLGVALAASLALTAVHLAVGGHVVPNPVLAKARGLPLREGLQYLGKSVPWPWAWAVAALAVGLFSAASRASSDARASNAEERMAALFAVAYLGFIVASGGDWMYGGRFLANVAPLLGLLIASGASRIAPARIDGAPLALALVIGNVVPMLRVVGGTRTGRPMWVVPKMRALVEARYPGARYGWFELASGVNLRDIPLSEALSEVIERVASVKPGPVVVASRQAGFRDLPRARAGARRGPLRRPREPDDGRLDAVRRAVSRARREGGAAPVRALARKLAPAELTASCALVRPERRLRRQPGGGHPRRPAQRVRVRLPAAGAGGGDPIMRGTIRSSSPWTTSWPSARSSSRRVEGVSARFRLGRLVHAAPGPASLT